ncbi:hypothetical protein GCM10007417_20930 [Glycocaulis alkaliphilus]|nr:hypothetical protein GCM10007417_20930 [Glycocaulis alkaliphilus]
MKRARFFFACVLLIWMAPGCTPAPSADSGHAPRPFLDLESQPPSNQIMPPQMVRISGMVSPVRADQITGTWHAGMCELTLSGDGLQGEAAVSGECPPGLDAVSGWVIEAEHRARLSLADQNGNELWAGIYTRTGLLSGIAAGSGALEFAR